MYRNHSEAQAARSARKRKPGREAFDAMVLNELRALCNARQRNLRNNMGATTHELALFISPDDAIAKMWNVTMQNRNYKVAAAFRRLRTRGLVFYDAYLGEWCIREWSAPRPTLRLVAPEE